MADEYGFFSTSAVAAPPRDAEGPPEWAALADPATANPSAAKRGLIVVLASALLVACVVAARYKLPAEYDNLVAHEQVSNSAAGWVPLYTSGSQPARWDPCTPIHYVVNPSYAPPSGIADLKGALARLQKASGLRFVFDGETAARPSDSAGSGVRAGSDGQLHWAPVVIGWEPLGTSGGIEGETVPVAVPGPDGGSIVTATVAINSDLLLPPGFGPGVSEGLVVLHELGHAVGLGHVADPAQVMYPRVKGGYADFGAGDRAGLAALGAPAGCHPAPAARKLRLQLDGTG